MSELSAYTSSLVVAVLLAVILGLTFQGSVGAILSITTGAVVGSLMPSWLMKRRKSASPRE